MALLPTSLNYFNIYFKIEEYGVYKRPRVLGEVKKKILYIILVGEPLEMRPYALNDRAV